MFLSAVQQTMQYALGILDFRKKTHRVTLHVCLHCAVYWNALVLWAQCNDIVNFMERVQQRGGGERWPRWHSPVVSDRGRTELSPVTISPKDKENTSVIFTTFLKDQIIPKQYYVWEKDIEILFWCCGFIIDKESPLRTKGHVLFCTRCTFEHYFFWSKTIFELDIVQLCETQMIRLSL